MNVIEHRRIARPLSCALLAGLFCAAFAPGAFANDPARHEPVTGDMLGGAATPAPATRTVEPHAARVEDAASDPSLPDVDLVGPAGGFEPDPGTPIPAYANAPAPYVPPSRSHGEIGSTTRHLLQLQADNAIAGPPRPMLGAEASAAYQRYLDSFNHPIPEFFETNVETASGGSQ